MNKFDNSGFFRPENLLKQARVGIVLLTGLLLSALPASAHHLMGGKVPGTFFEGFITGIAHPLIGLDHLAFIVAVGLLAAIQRRGILIPFAFVLAAMLGTGAHLAKLNLPGIELLVSGSILLFGVLLVLKERPNTIILVGLSAIAGICHGYAYGESIFGAETAPLLAYLLGFTVIQLIIALAVFGLGKKILQRQTQPSTPILSSAGLVLCGVGLAFLSSQVINLLLPLPKG